MSSSRMSDHSKLQRMGGEREGGRMCVCVVLFQGLQEEFSQRQQNSSDAFVQWRDREVSEHWHRIFQLILGR